MRPSTPWLHYNEQCQQICEAGCTSVENILIDPHKIMQDSSSSRHCDRHAQIFSSCNFNKISCLLQLERKSEAQSVGPGYQQDTSVLWLHKDWLTCSNINLMNVELIVYLKSYWQKCFLIEIVLHQQFLVLSCFPPFTLWGVKLFPHKYAGTNLLFGSTVIKKNLSNTIPNARELKYVQLKVMCPFFLASLWAAYS